MIIDKEKKTATFDLFLTSELCPEEEEDVLVITKRGQVTTARYLADELGDVWVNNDTESEDHFFAQDDIMYWAYLSNLREASL